MSNRKQKGFPSSNYDAISEYWSKMSPRDRGAYCYKSQAMYGGGKISRMHCDYEKIYSYEKVIARRYTIDKKEAILLLEGYDGVTTRKHISSVHRALGWNNEDIIEAPEPNINSRKDASLVIDSLFRDILKLLETLSKSRSESVKERIAKTIQTKRNNAIRFWDMFKKYVPRTTIEYKILKNVSAYSKLDDINFQLETVRRRRVQDTIRNNLNHELDSIAPKLPAWISGEKELSVSLLAADRLKCITRVKNSKIESLKGLKIDVLLAGMIYGKYLSGEVKKGDSVSNAIFKGIEIIDGDNYININGILIPEKLMTGKLKSSVVRFD